MSLTKATYSMIEGAPVNVLDYGADPTGVANSTAAIQAAINAALNSIDGVVFFPSGIYSFTTINVFDASGTERAKRGKITLLGEGRMAAPDLKGETSQRYGTVLKSTATTGNAIVCADGSTLHRGVVLENLSVITSTTGYAVYTDYCPEFQLKSVGIRCENAASNGVYANNVWFGTINDCIIEVDFNLTSTGNGLRFSNSIFAGIFNVFTCLFDGFKNNISIQSGTNWANFIVRDSALQVAVEYGLLCEKPVWNLELDNVYFEDNGISDVKIAPSSGTVSVFNANNIFTLGGSQTASYSSGPCFDLANVDQYEISNVKYFRPWNPFLALTGSIPGKISNIDVQADNLAALPAGPLYMVTSTTGVLPSLANETITSSSKLDWYNTATSIAGRHSALRITPYAFSAGTMKAVSLVADVYDVNTTPRPLSILVTATGGGASAVLLPLANANSTGDFRLVINSTASTQSIVLRNGTTSPTTISTVAPGEMASCYSDAVNNKWVIAKSTISYGP